MLTLKHLTVSVEKHRILHDVNFTFEKGKVYAVMGPNGSGKSTLASTVMGHPSYTIDPRSQIIYQNEKIHECKPEERAKKGIFLSFQSPLSLSGVTIYQLMRYMCDKRMDPVTIRSKVKIYAKSLKIPVELLERSLNEGFSGGERKKMEVLQAAMSGASFLFFDEVDTGVDIDALKTIASFLKKLKGKQKTIVVITHYNRILKQLIPDEVIVLNKGNIMQTGDYRLAHLIERKGYAGLT